MVVFKASQYILHGITPPATKSIAHSLLVSNAFIHPVGRGLYSLLPLGNRVVSKLCNLIDTELDAVGAQKVSMPIIAPKELWDKSGRWDAMGAEMFKMSDRTGANMCLQPTAEEMCTQLIAQLPKVKRSMLPIMIYQTTEKFRDEMNPRFGLLRGRQFLMNDLYSFDIDQASSENTYHSITKAYDRIFSKLEVEYFRVRADSGVHGGRLSEEFHFRNALDEDGIHYCFKCRSGCKRDEAPNLEKCSNPDCKSSDRATFSTVEVAHTFQLGTKYAEALKALYSGNPVEMCCFGIGVTRVVAAALEALSPSDSIMRLPKAIAPFDAAVIVSKSLQNNVLLEMVLSTLNRRLRGGILFDDRVDMNVGKRLKDLNRLGIPRVIVLGKATEKSLNETPLVEYLTCEPSSDDLIKHGELSFNNLIQIL